jgi:hypothetical protein
VPSLIHILVLEALGESPRLADERRGSARPLDAMNTGHGVIVTVRATVMAYM